PNPSANVTGGHHWGKFFTCGFQGGLGQAASPAAGTGLLRGSGTGRRRAHATCMTRAMAGRCRYGSFKRNCFAAVDARRNNQTMPRGDEMPKKDASLKLNRRKFLTAAAVAGASGAVNPAKAATAAEPRQRLPSALPPNAHVAAGEAGVPDIPPYAGEGRPGSDFMVDVIKTLDIKYLPANPASSYRAIHESLINYGKNTMPEFLTCTHEEVGVGMGHGYYKIAGKPLMTLVH